MTAAPNVDFTVIEDLDFDPACTRKSCPHGNPTATHIARSAFPCGCTGTDLACDACTADLRSKCAITGSWRCVAHPAFRWLGRFGDWITIERIKP